VMGSGGNILHLCRPTSQQYYANCRRRLRAV